MCSLRPVHVHFVGMAAAAAAAAVVMVVHGY